MKYSIKAFDAEFPTDAACLEYIYRARWPRGKTCDCGKSDCFHRIAGRRAYSCAWCGAQVYPTAGTIFHKSETPLKSWFFSMFLMAQSRNGVAAKELQRQLGVTYKTAHRMGHKIRQLMHGNGAMLSGIVEIDEAYIGGKRPGKRGRGAAGKTAVIGIAERRGGVTAKVVDVANTATAMREVRKNIAPQSKVISDESPIYNYVPKFGFLHETVNHSAGEYVRARIHTNTIEGFWSQVKRSIDGTHHAVSRKWLQHYVDEFSFRYSHRFSESPMFSLIARRAGKQLSAAA